MPALKPFTFTVKEGKTTAHVTVVNFDPDKHQDIYNRELAKQIRDQYEKKEYQIQ